MSIWNRLRNSLGMRDSVDDRVRDEIAFHIDERTQENIAAGMSAAEARREARLRFGSNARVAAETRDANLFGWMEALVRDSRVAWRSLAKRPALVTTSILSLALGIGATAAIFSVVDAVILKPLPIPDPDRLVMLRESRFGKPIGGNPARLKDWQAQARSFEAVAGFYGEQMVMMNATGEAEFVATNRTFGPWARVFGLTPARGRTMTAAEERSDGNPVAIVTHEFWQQRLQGDTSIIGKPLTLGDKAYTVIGILPPKSYSNDAGIWLAADPSFQAQGRTGNWFGVVARLKAGIDLSQAQAEATTIARGLAAAYPATDESLGARVIPYQEWVSGPAREPLMILLATVAAVLLVACLNIASLLAARALERQRESALRISLGAGRPAIVRQYLVESGWLALGGGMAGLLLAAALIEVLRKTLPAELPRVDEVALDWRVALFGAGASMLSGIVFGLAPAWQSIRGASMDGLREGGRTAGLGASKLWTRRGLVAGQVAFSLMLLVAATLLGRSFAAMQRSEMGFRADHVLAVSLHSAWDTEAAQLNRLYAQSLEALAALPGVQSVGVSDRLPLTGESQTRTISIAGRNLSTELRESYVGRRMASASYFATLRAPLRRGRVFSDRADAPLEVVANEAFVRRFLPEVDPVGQRITFDKLTRAGGPRYWEIVGVVGDIRHNAQKEDAAPPELFTSYQRTTWPQAEFVIRASGGDPLTLADSVRQTIARIEPKLPIRKMRTLDAHLAESFTEPRVHSWLLGGFALTALLLAAVGLYGVLASDVAQRTREIGVRLALGAEPAEVSRLTLSRGLGVAGVGLVIGAAGAIGLARFLKSLLFAIEPLDPWSFAIALVILLCVAMAACWLPSRRAARVDPVVALRHE